MHRWSNFSAFAVYKPKLKEIKEEKKNLQQLESRCYFQWFLSVKNEVEV